ncbi:MAG: metallophosphoesterase [Pseudomonadota bacterium]
MNQKLFALLLIGFLTGCVKTPVNVASPSSEVIIYAVGDIAECRDKPAAEAPANLTANFLRQTQGTILALGDIAYPKGREIDFSSCFQPIWGDLKPRMLPVPGNHEYLTDSAAPYYAYFGTVAGSPGKGYYSTRIGAWRIIALNSNIDTQTGSEQERWLRSELAADKTKCTLAFWHHPLFASSPRGNNPKMQNIWQTLYENGVDVVLNGHEHQYERFAPQTPAGEQDSTRGVRQFIVGTGGAMSNRFAEIKPNSEARATALLGVIELTLREDSYAWKFIPVAGQTFQDSGEGRCHD